MYSFVVSIKPKSYNRKKKDSGYELRIQAAFRKSYPIHVPAKTELYGLVYHFFNRDIGIDADNLSKPIWDSLRGVIFEDDKQVKMRISGSFDIAILDLTILDFSGLSGHIVNELLDALETDEHVLYIECGDFSTALIRLNWE